jgi:hypothetical protein
MNAFIITKLGSIELLYYACAECGALFHANNKGAAEKCCSPSMTRCMVSGCEAKKEKDRNMCKRHGDEHTAKVEAERWAKAETVVEYEQVTNGAGDYWADLDDYREELEPGTPEHYLWSTRRVIPVVDAETILQNLAETWWPGEDDIPKINGEAEFVAACKALQDANQTSFLLEPDYTKKIYVPRTPSDEDGNDEA